MIEVFRRVLVLSPHTDDGEFGAGGLIHRLVQVGACVDYVAFSGCEESVPQGFPKNVLRSEVYAATTALGLPERHVKVLNFRVRRFGEARQDILDALIALRAEIKPDLVLLPSVTDCHQDHQIIATEGLRAFKFLTRFHYEISWNEQERNNNIYVSLSRENLDAKINAIEKYRSQRMRTYASSEAITSLARVRGVQSGVEFAEAFTVGRLFIR